MLFVEPIVRYLENFRSPITYSELDCSVCNVYSTFLIFNVFLITTISGTIFSVLEQILLQPSNIVNLLATGLGKQSSFFINYILVQSAIYPLELIRIVPFFLSLWSKWRALTIEERREYLNQGAFDYPYYYSTEVLIFVIALTYSTMTPFMLPFALLFFSLGYMITKYNLIYVNMPKYEGNGHCWPTIANQLFSGVIIYQLTMIGQFASKKFAPGAILIVLLLLTIYFWYYINRRFKRPASFVSLDDLTKTPLLADERGVSSNAHFDTMPSQLKEKILRYYMQRELLDDNHPLNREYARSEGSTESVE